jgi:hypothetical protein
VAFGVDLLPYSENAGTKDLLRNAWWKMMAAGVAEALGFVWVDRL